MNTSFPQVMILGLAALLAGGCATHTVRTTTYEPVVTDSEAIPEEFLMDVGVAVFDPGLDEIDDEEEETTNHQIRLAESRYAPYLLAETLIRSGNWGIVYVMPNDASPMDIRIDGTILQSTGESMAMRVRVSDATGRHWYTKEYSEAISQFAYEPGQRAQNDPFQVLYNSIANDLLAWRKANMSNERIAEIRSVSEMRFAQRFSPEAFNGFLDADGEGNYNLTALPAESDPSLRRIREIRERDYMFMDTVQEYYSTFTREMREPYDSWREQSYHETLVLRELEANARRRFIAGTAIVIGGIAAAAGGGDYVSRVGGGVAAAAGVNLVMRGFNTQAEAQLHMQALEEMGASLEGEVAPRVISLEDQTITLTGSVEEQYEQWREILADIYAVERGELR
ncbi:MAG: hypothetical protein F4121_02355 [Acidimicrobiia bacterium]|nr:hypothetical protein [Gammaproteobacteria bacterium]MYE29085.1 hypothetical protein [Gammaproteobacteria bacterium]MYI18952.1 hypothetical protein [Acidimicrobiia bacterium]